MERTLFSFLVTFLAGISTILGIIPCFFKDKKKETIISFSLAFSSGIMLTISFISLIPEAVILFRNIFKTVPLVIICLIFIVLGIIFSLLIDAKVEKYFSKNKLYKLGIISIIVLMFHNIPEGITTFISTSKNISLGLSLSVGIALHNIPEGISVAVPIYYSTNSLKKAIFYTLVSGFSEFFGAVIAYLFIAKYVNDFILGLILAITAGIMLHISLYELLPNSLEYKKNKTTIIGFILGIFLMFLCKSLF